MTDQNANSEYAEDRPIEISQPKMDTSSQVKKTILNITEPLKKERATKREIN